MTNKPTTPQSLQEQLRELEEEAEKKKVKLTPEVQQYIRNHLEAVQEKLAKGEPVFEEDMEFMGEVRMWVGLSEELREKWSSIDKMVGSEEMKEAQNRHISLKQWLDLLHMSEAKNRIENIEWIDETFKFPGGGKINMEGSLILHSCTGLTALPEGLNIGGELELPGCTGLTALPERLSVGRNLDIYGCTGLTALSERLSIGGNSYLSEDMNDQVKKEAKRLKEEGKIKGKIIIGFK